MNEPGTGWTNGSIDPQMVRAETNNGGGESLKPIAKRKTSINETFVRRFSSRRLLQTQESWTRIGDADPNDPVIQTGNSERQIKQQDEDEDETAPCPIQQGITIKALMSQLSASFYAKAWKLGTGGGLSIRIGSGSTQDPYRVFCTPSGIQREDMIVDDVFELDMSGNIIVPPTTPGLKLSSMTNLWYIVYKYRPTAKCVIHTHSMNAQLATLLFCKNNNTPNIQTINNVQHKVFSITHLEMIKGVGNHAYNDTLHVPIIPNQPSENLLASDFSNAIQAFPKCNAILVERHGVYVWGDSWEQAKTQLECFDYLFESAVQMSRLGLDWTQPPTVNAVTTKTTNQEVENDFRGVTQQDNRLDLLCASTTKKRKYEESDEHSTTKFIPMSPLLPRDSKIILLDIEGCTTAISFVHDVLFPYARDNLNDFLDKLNDDDLIATLLLLENDVQQLDTSHPARVMISSDVSLISNDSNSVRERIQTHVRGMMKHDVKATGLKSLQGKIWKFGYDNHTLQGHVYSDFQPFLQWCKSQNVSVNIYSSGSIGAQKLLFGHSTDGDLCHYFDHHFDTTSGGKKESLSYTNIAKQMGVSPSDIVFVSDAEGELVAAREAGIGHCVMSVRPGNAPLTDVGREFPIIYSLLQLCGAVGLES